MRTVVAIIMVAVVGGAVALYALADAATATFLLIAWGIVCGLGAAPVVFSVITRRRAAEFNRRLDAAEKMGDGTDGGVQREEVKQ